MRISNLKIENFRSVRELDIDIPQICALVGPNNAGKSNILAAIQRVIGRDWVGVSSFDDDDVCGRDPDRDIKIALSFDPAPEFKRFKHSDPVKIDSLSFEYTRYKVGEHRGQRRLDQKCMKLDGSSIYVPKGVPKKGVKLDFEPLVGIPTEVREAIPLIYIGTNRSIKDHLPGARYSLLRQLFEDVNRDLHDPSRTVKVERSGGKWEEVARVEHFYSIMEEAMNLLRTEEFIALENSIKRNALRQLGFDPETDVDKLDFFFSPFDTMDFYKSLDLQVREGNFTISATELGEGFQNALALSILQAFEERKKQGAILLIEEPEMFLHPQMQRSLYKVMREIGKTNQIIYTTHSPHFVTIPEYEEVLLVRRNADSTRVRATDLLADSKRREKLIKELDPERNELFFAARLLLVEGDTEKLAVPEYAKRLGFDLDREGATVVEVGGKRNLPEFAKIAISFGIHTGIVYDLDSSDFGDKREEEKEFNKGLDSFAREDGLVQVWALDKKFEDHVRRALGDKKYQELCQKYPQVGKPTRGRLIAAEDNTPVPEPFEEILRWLANKPSEEAEE